ncbi:hypothetical protein PMAYCL1PPCAC_21661, partial [Pristionchus mayeri]
SSCTTQQSSQQSCTTLKSEQTPHHARVSSQHSSPSHAMNEEELMDQEALLLQGEQGIQMDFVESMYNYLSQELCDVKEDINGLRAFVSNEFKSLRDEIGSMNLTLSAVLNKVTQPPPITQSVSNPTTPRVSIAPRSQFRTPNSFDRPTHSRDRSRSP